MGRAVQESYEPIVPKKVGNAGEDPGDPLEGRGEQTNASDEGNMTGPRNRTIMFTRHIRIAELAKEDKGRQFYSIAHLLTVDALYEAFESLRKDAGAGVDRLGEFSLKNRVREIRTLGSVRGVVVFCYGEPKRARSWKRRIPPRGSLRHRMASPTRTIATENCA